MSISYTARLTRPVWFRDTIAGGENGRTMHPGTLVHIWGRPDSECGSVHAQVGSAPEYSGDVTADQIAIQGEDE